MATLVEGEAWVADGTQGSWEEEAQFRMGIQSLKENTSQALGFQILTTRMEVNMLVFPLNFESWIGEHEI